MDGENGKRLNTNDDNVAEERGVAPFSVDSNGNSTREEESKVEGSSSECSSNDVPIESTLKEWSDASFVATESPPIQVMERPNESGRTDGSPGRWSVDSNDSLFSIGMGNNSFSNMDVSPGTITATGELSLSEAYLPRLQLYQSEEKVSKSPAAPKGVDVDVKPPPVSIHTESTHSDDQDITRNESFVSPEMKEASCPMCKCLHCHGMDCCCRWPSCDCCCRRPTCDCCCRWPNCFSWPSCSTNCCSCCNKCCASFFCCACCNRESKRAHSFSSYALMDRSITNSSKHNS